MRALQQAKRRFRKAYQDKTHPIIIHYIPRFSLFPEVILGDYKSNPWNESSLRTIIVTRKILKGSSRYLMNKFGKLWL